MKITSQLVYGPEADPYLLEYIARRTGNRYHGATAIGLARGSRILAVVAYNNFNWPDIFMHIGAEPGALWATRDFFQCIFHYPFVQLNCKRATALVARKNKASRNLCEKLGFTLEGKCTHALPNDDLIIYGMLRDKCRYLEAERKAA